MAHYSIFHHLVRAHALLESFGGVSAARRLEEDIFFHMSAATEMVDRLLFVICRVWAEVTGQPFPQPRSLDWLLKRCRSLHRKSYSKHFDRHLETGRSVAVTLHNIREVAQLIVGVAAAEGQARHMWTVADGIRNYRNFLTHNPLIPKLVRHDGTVLLPKPEKLHQYDLWSSAFYREADGSDYVPSSDIIRDYLCRFECSLDQLWGPILSLLRRLSATRGYAQMRPPTPAVGLPNSAAPSLGVLAGGFTSSQASGTSSAFDEAQDDLGANLAGQGQ